MLVNINKPAGITSHDVVDRVRAITGEKRVGHAGTLDPFAEGVLVVAVGREDTKKLGQLTKDTEKEYAAVLELGKTSSTGDPEGEITPADSLGILPTLSEESISSALSQFIGDIEQVPPRHSAIKVQGVASYKLAREGTEVELPSRRVHIADIRLEEYTPPFLTIRTTCGAGTYIRALARDIGTALGTGAYLTELTRTRVGDYRIEDSMTLDEFSRQYSSKSG